MDILISTTGINGPFHSYHANTRGGIGVLNRVAVPVDDSVSGDWPPPCEAPFEVLAGY